MINIGSAHNFLSIVRDAETAIDTLIINSSGGVTISARRIGRWVHEHDVTVIVENLCFSSCANYIFTAAPKKIIRDGAYIGWHGSEQQLRYVTPPIVVNGEIIERGGCRTDEEISVIGPGLDTADEEAFLEQIGVSVDALLYGLMPGRCEHYYAAGVAGWSFSIGYMAQFGIANVAYEGDEYPAPQSLRPAAHHPLRPRRRPPPPLRCPAR